jgi:heptosyltransferase II
LNNNIDKPFKALIELPTWLGDSVMTTPAIENIIKYYSNIEITIIGPYSSIEIIKNHPKVVKTIILDSKSKSLFISLTKNDVFDVFFTFRGSLRAKFLKFRVKALKKYQFNYKNYPNRHQVEKYVDFINQSLSSNYPAGNLINYINKSNNKNSRILGINPGASYGSAKRWYPDQFAKVAIALSDKFDIMIFGGIGEKNFAQQIEKHLLSNHIYNFQNLAGKTSISELTYYISNLDIFVTGDSGPMHLAASLEIPTIAIFGPTDSIETSQWKNSKSVIIKKNLDCQPCMKRTCPLKHHNCMKLINAQEVIDSISIIREY